MVCCGFLERVLHGVIYRNATGHGRQWQGDFIDGGKMVFGKGFYNCSNQLADAEGQFNWEVHYVDGSVIRAHQHAAGGHCQLNEANSKLGTIISEQPYR